MLNTVTTSVVGMLYFCANASLTVSVKPIPVSIAFASCSVVALGLSALHLSMAATTCAVVGPAT